VKPLTDRELDVMVALAVTGGSYAETAQILGIKGQTVRNYAMAARTKLRVASNAAAFSVLGWLDVPWELRRRC
jgi:DNA-binding CsgD family transcriptional regulator